MGPLDRIAELREINYANWQTLAMMAHLPVSTDKVELLRRAIASSDGARALIHEIADIDTRIAKALKEL